MSEEYIPVDREFDWDDEISNEGSEFTVLPEGEYDFEVTKVERSRSKGSDKLPPCNMAVVTLRVTDGKNTATITDQLVLHSKMEWKLCQFFLSIGLRQHGEKLKMNWSAVTGSKGRCKVYVDEWEGRDGSPKKSNKIDRYLDPDEVPVAAAPQQSSYWS